ncbi:MAG: hypothetical protein LBK67_05850 [Coriobacteriales bacterium]|nr:hypothetical protein [Coriobacteriales bacterium]
MRKILGIILVAILGFALIAMVGCSGSEQPASDANAAGNADQPAGDSGNTTELPNPIVEVDGPDAFKQQLGFNLEPDQLGSNPTFSIIDDKIAEVEYGIETDGANVQVVARAQKTTTAEDISGINDTFSMVEPGQAVGDVTTTLSYDEGGLGYVFWYNAAAGISGCASMSTGASDTALDNLAQFYINQENQGS